MDVVRQRAGVVEELREHRPSVIFVPERLADHVGAEQLYDIPQQDLFRVADDHVAQAFILRRAGSVLSPGRGRKPALVNTAARAQNVVVGRMQLDAFSRSAE